MANSVVTPYFSDDLRKISSLILVYMVNVYTCVSLFSVPGPTLSGKLVYNLYHWSCQYALLFSFLQSVIKYGRHMNIFFSICFQNDNSELLKLGMCSWIWCM